MSDSGFQAMIAVLRRAIGQLKSESLGGIFVRGTSGSAMTQGVSILGALLVQLLLTQALGVKDYGYFVVAWTWAMLLAIPCQLGFHNSLIRFTATYRSRQDWGRLRGVMRVAVVGVLIVSTVSGALLAGSATLLEANLPPDQLYSLVVAGAAVPALALIGILQAVLKGYRHPVLAQLARYGLVYLGIGLLCGGAWLLNSLNNAPLALGLSVVAGWSAVLITVYWVRRSSDREMTQSNPTYQTRYWLSASLPLMLMAGMTGVLSQVGTVMVGAMVDGESAAIYAIASQISQCAAFALLASNAIVAPLVAEYFASRNYKGLSRLLFITAWVVTAFAVAASLVFLFLGQWILSLFGAAFTDGYTALLILLVGQLANAVCGPVGVVLTMTGYQNEAAAVMTAAAVANVGLNGLLVPMLGIEGAALASSLTFVFWNLTLLVLVKRNLGLSTWIFKRLPLRNSSAGQQAI